jgi:quercetin dioxygenase-like cupin family protein
MNNSENLIPIFPKGEKASADYFVGNVWIKNLIPADETFHMVIGNVVFEPGARNNWHTHPGGQILIATDGTGYYQQRGSPVQIVRKGDVIIISPGIEHWHGASPNSKFTHIAVNPNVQNGIVDWLQKVTDEEYNNI